MLSSQASRVIRFVLRLKDSLMRLNTDLLNSRHALIGGPKRLQGTHCGSILYVFTGYGSHFSNGRKKLQPFGLLRIRR
jgi:hypothetical protein